ncbi:MAG: hypothetical protein LBP60_05640 [Spirochaetaceae bacterium]|jgi:hypothetical protein|nr:hypothetical protein [Spirochaetaceae bacterium]
MSLYIFSKKEAALKGLFKKASPVFSGLKDLSKHKAQEGDISYLDLSGLTAADAKKTATQLKKRCKDTPWGIIDPRGSSKDPALWFFAGASDYLGPGALAGVDPKRLSAAALWRQGPQEDSAREKRPGAGIGLPKTGIKLPGGRIPGWKEIPTGKLMPFYLLYCSLQGKNNLTTRFGEEAYSQLHKRFLAHLSQSFQKAEGLVWMDSGKDCLMLIPPKTKNAEEAVVACIRLLLSVPIITIETLNLNVPVNFIFALHYGAVKYKPPGKTGTVVSDAVNFIFHLGTKQAESGRLTISGEIPDNTIPKALEDWFVSAGEYEGRQIWQTKKIGYLRPWM